MQGINIPEQARTYPQVIKQHHPPAKHPGTARTQSTTARAGRVVKRRGPGESSHPGPVVEAVEAPIDAGLIVRYSVMTFAASCMRPRMSYMFETSPAASLSFTP